MLLNDTTNDAPRFCECGCGQTIKQAKNPKRQRRFITGHNVKPTYATIEDRFWASCIKGDVDACWGWQGNKDRHGYGLMNFRHKDYLAHRISYQIHHGAIPPGLWVCHHCDNPPCTNPNHLFSGTPADNSADMVKKNRQTRGITRAKLTESDIPVIRHLYKQGVSQYELAKRYGISRGAIAAVVRRESWPHIPQPKA